MVAESKPLIQLPSQNGGNGIIPSSLDKYKNTKEQLFPEVKFCDISASSMATLSIKNTPAKNGDLINKKNNNNNQQQQPRKRLISNDLESAESIISSSAGDKKKSQIPDGGYGWVVVFTSFCVSLIADGVSFSFGLLFTEFLQYFKESKSKTAWIGSLFLAVPLLSGPIMSNLVDKYGCRRMTMIGGLLSSTGFALASMCNSIEMLYITFGFIAGLGLGIGYVTAVVSIAFWFDKKRTFATGIGASGTGIGTFLYAPFTQWLIEYFGWRGATLILAGTLANTCVFGALMRDPDWLIEENRLESCSQSVTTFSNSSCNLDEIKKLLETGATKEAVLDTLVTNFNTEANQSIMDPDDTGIIKRYRSEIFLPTYLNSQELESIDEVKSQSRRSLRQKSNHDTLSRENLLSMSSGNDVPPPSQIQSSTFKNNFDNKRKYLASVETLSPSEKLPTRTNTPLRYSITSIKSHEKLSREPTLDESSFSDEGFITMEMIRDNSQNERLLNSSRYSLNENLINKCNESLINIHKLYRGNSLDILNDDVCPTINIQDNLIEKRNTTAELIEANLKRFNNGIVETIHEDQIANFDCRNCNGGCDVNCGDDDPANSGNKKQQQQRAHRSSIRRNISIKNTNTNCLRNMIIHRNSIHYRGALLNTHRYRLRASSCPNIYRNSMTTIAREDEDTWYDNFVDIIKSVFDFSLFLDLKFTIFNLSTFLLFIWFIIPYFYITEHMKTYNYKEEDSAMLISIIGIFNTIGMVTLGFIGDRPWLNVNITYSICMLFCGLSVSLMPLAVQSYPALIALAVIFGLTFASTFSFTPSILVSLVDLDDFTCAYGLVLLVQGVGSLIGPPLAGVIYDITLRWDDSFYAAGFFIACSGILSYILEILERRDRKKNNINNNNNNNNLKSNDSDF